MRVHDNLEVLATRHNGKLIVGNAVLQFGDLFLMVFGARCAGDHELMMADAVLDVVLTERLTQQSSVLEDLSGLLLGGQNGHRGRCVDAHSITGSASASRCPL